jgi:hypothetical protein
MGRDLRRRHRRRSHGRPPRPPRRSHRPPRRQLPAQGPNQGGHPPETSTLTAQFQSGIR